MPDTSTIVDPRGVGYILYLSMQKYRERIAQFDVTTEMEQTYEELLERCVGTAIAMENQGLKPGDFVSICSHNHFDISVPYIASLFSGVVTASVEPSMSAPEIIYLLNQVMPKIIFVGRPAVGLIEEVVQKLEVTPLIVVFGENSKYVQFSEFVTPFKSGDGFKPRQPTNPSETALVIFSSGTTGRPKGICHSHSSLLSNNQWPEAADCSTVAWFTTPYWATFYIGAHMWILNGLRRLVFPHFDGGNPWAILNFKIDFLLTNPVQALAFLTHETPNDINVGNLVRFRFGGCYVSKDQALELHARLPQTFLIYTFGQSELFGVLFGFTFDSIGQALTRKYPTSVGTPKNGVVCRIVDMETGKVLGPNQQGELRVKATFQCKGYFNQDSSEMYDSEGWLKTGDLAYYNEEKCFFITNRIKESFKYKGNHIIPTDIEDVLHSHPSIGKAVVLGLPHKTDGNHPMALIVPNEKGATVREEQIVKYVEERVEDKCRLRGGVKIVSEIPLTVTDKVNRFKLRQMVLNKEI